MGRTPWDTKGPKFVGLHIGLLGPERIKRKDKAGKVEVVDDPSWSPGAWQKLTSTEKVIYLYIKARYDTTNNGRIVFTQEQAKIWAGIKSATTMSRAIDGLKTKGWIRYRRGDTGLKTPNLYTLTFRHDTFGMGEFDERNTHDKVDDELSGSSGSFIDEMLKDI